MLSSPTSELPGSDPDGSDGFNTDLPASTRGLGSSASQIHNQQLYAMGLPRLLRRNFDVPPSDEERFLALEGVRHAMLQSTNPETQLAWAQDVLRHVDTFLAYRERLEKLPDDVEHQPEAERRLQSDAMSIVLFLSDQGHPRADFIRGLWLEHGKLGLPQDKAEAKRRYKQAAAKGFARAHYRLGLYHEAKNDPRALDHYRIGEMRRDSACCFRMGMILLLGLLSQARNHDRAVHLLRQAADNADENTPQSAYVFGMLLADELPEIRIPESILSRNVATAKQYVKKAAFLGFSKAQLRMGCAYELGTLGCEFDPIHSLHYYALAARRGEAKADMAISKWLLCGHEDLVPKNEALALQYTLRATVSGLVLAYFAMGYYHEVGIAMQVNIPLAVQWYKKAAARGNVDAVARLQAMKRSETLHKSDHDRIALAKIRLRHGSCRPRRGLSTTVPQMLPSQQLVQTPMSLMSEGAKSNLHHKGLQGVPNATVPLTGPDQRLASTAPRLESINAPAYHGRPMRSVSHEPPSNKPTLQVDTNAFLDTLGSLTVRPPPDPARPHPHPRPNPTKTTDDRSTRNFSKPCPPPRTPPLESARDRPPRHQTRPLSIIPTPTDLSHPPPSALEPKSTPTPTAEPGAPPPEPATLFPSKQTTKGPQTFEEMGIPYGKLDNDCVSLSPLFSIASPDSTGFPTAFGLLCGTLTWPPRRRKSCRHAAQRRVGVGSGWAGLVGLGRVRPALEEKCII